MRIAAWLRLSAREETRKTAEILIPRHQLAVLQRRQEGRPKPDWADRALLATLLSVIPTARRYGLQLLIHGQPRAYVRTHGLTCSFAVIASPILVMTPRVTRPGRRFQSALYCPASGGASGEHGIGRPR